MAPERDAGLKQDMAQAKIEELRAAVVSERALRRKAESRSLTLARELEEEKERTAARERAIRELEEAVQREKGKAREAMREMTTAWEIREAGLIMKLSDARLEMGEKLEALKLEGKVATTLGRRLIMERLLACVCTCFLIYVASRLPWTN